MAAFVRWGVCSDAVDASGSGGLLALRVAMVISSAFTTVGPFIGARTGGVAAQRVAF